MSREGREGGKGKIFFANLAPFARRFHSQLELHDFTCAKNGVVI